MDIDEYVAWSRLAEAVLVRACDDLGGLDDSAFKEVRQVEGRFPYAVDADGWVRDTAFDDRPGRLGWWLALARVRSTPWFLDQVRRAS